MISYWNILECYLQSDFQWGKYIWSRGNIIFYRDVMLGWSQIREWKMFMSSPCFRAVLWCRSFFHYIRILKYSYFRLRFHAVTWDVEHLNCLLKECIESVSPFFKYLWWEKRYNWSNTKNHFTFVHNSCVLKAFFFFCTNNKRF